MLHWAVPDYRGCLSLEKSSLQAVAETLEHSRGLPRQVALHRSHGTPLLILESIFFENSTNWFVEVVEVTIGLMTIQVAGSMLIGKQMIST